MFWKRETKEPAGLSAASVRKLLFEVFEELGFRNQRVLVIVPDLTRTAPLPFLFRLFQELLSDRVLRLDYLVALGTHQPLSEQAWLQLFQLDHQTRAKHYAATGFFNHEWKDPTTFQSLGEFSAEEVFQLSQGRFRKAVPIGINRKVFDYDRILICGPVFPHEVAGFSGGNKYLFPGISGQALIDFTHWLGALITCPKIIGVEQNPVRNMIDQAAEKLGCPKLYLNLVMRGETFSGLSVGEDKDAWLEAVRMSRKENIRYVKKPFKKVLSIMPPMYDEIWTAAKGMYKLEPVVKDGGELIIYAPHIDRFSTTHGEILSRVGYHVRDYFVKQWDRFQHFPWGVLAHSTHLKGAGIFENGREQARIRVCLATRIPEEECRRLDLGYCDPATLQLEKWAGREDEGILVVPKAGEVLYRLQDEA